MADALLDKLSVALDAARRYGAESADALAITGHELSYTHRLGKPEELEQSESAGIGLRVFMGSRQAAVSSTDLKTEALAEMAERACAMAKAAPPDPHGRIAGADEIASSLPALDLEDPQPPTLEWLREQAARTEEAALGEKGITNSEGASASASATEVALMTSSGFSGHYRGHRASLSVSVIAGEGTGMQRDYDYHMTRRAADLEPAEEIGRRAAERTLRRMNPQRMPTGDYPVIFDPRVSRELLGHFAGAISGAAVARGTSFLKDKMGERLFAPGLAIIDDPLRPRGLASRPFDAEGLGSEQLDLIEDGTLRHWLLSLHSAAKLGLTSNGRASRGLSGSPSPSSTNLYIENGTASPKELIGSIKDGLYITESFGMGVNLVTGDYSQGASGFRIRSGKLAEPISEITIAGHLLAMFAALTPANDLAFRARTNAPTLLIGHMTVAGGGA